MLFEVEVVFALIEFELVAEFVFVDEFVFEFSVFILAPVFCCLTAFVG